ncbi:hypothetical protein [Treponema pedis]|uniref:hypothetical protein n=2 Tax=Treponema pedis TaxID=409322 RepID=UPI00197E753B|nr:hypothetical protein [Treponema pedis]QSI04805.1 hypothetical protein DYQ05_07640 [Treponema pedis]
MKREINKLLFLFFLVFLISCTEDSQIDVKQVLEVNDFNVIVFVKNVGATSDYSMNISIIEGNKKITNRDKGNIFIAKGMRNVFIKLKDNNIVVSHSYSDKDIFYKIDSYYGYNFVYENKPLHLFTV